MSAVIEERSGPLTKLATRDREQPTDASRTRSAIWPTAALVGLTAIGATLLFWLAHGSLIDDAYITLAYARTLADHGDWGMLPGHEANSATSPLNVLLLGSLTAIVGDPVAALGVLYVLTCVALAVGLRGLGQTLGLGYRVAVLGTPLLVASPLLASALGLETMLVVTAMIYLAWAGARGDATTAGLVVGVLLWLRLDTLVVAAGIVLVMPQLRRRPIRIAALAAAVIVPWLLFSWVVLDSAIPDTLVIKQGEPWGDFATGFSERYYEPYPWAVTGLLVVGIFGALAALTWPWWGRRDRTTTSVVPALAVAGAAYFGLMWLLEVPPFFWYYAPTLAALTLTAAIGLATLTTIRFGPEVRAAAATVGGALLVLTLVPWWNGATSHAPLREMPIHGNWAHPSEYAEIGRELHAIVGNAPVHSPGEVGALAYFCECTIVDRFSDRAKLAEAIDQARDDSWLYSLNYAGLDTDQLDPIKPRYRLDWRPGPDPSGRGWNTTGIAGGVRAHGHLVLLDYRPGRDDQQAPGQGDQRGGDPSRATSDQARGGSLR